MNPENNTFSQEKAVFDTEEGIISLRPGRDSGTIAIVADMMLRQGKGLPAVEVDTESKTRDACTGLDPKILHPGPREKEKIERAKQICGTCAVKTECLENALERGEKYGVWGGASEKERRDILKTRTKTKVA